MLHKPYVSYLALMGKPMLTAHITPVEGVEPQHVIDKLNELAPDIAAALGPYGAIEAVGPREAFEREFGLVCTRVLRDSTDCFMWEETLSQTKCPHNLQGMILAVRLGGQPSSGENGREDFVQYDLASGRCYLTNQDNLQAIYGDSSPDWGLYIGFIPICELNLSIDQVAATLGVEHHDYTEGVIGRCSSVVFKAENGDMLLTCFHDSQRPNSVVVQHFSTDCSPEQSLEQLCSALGIPVPDWMWFFEDYHLVTLPTWSLFRQGDDPVRVATFYMDHHANEAMRNVERRGHKQCYYIEEAAPRRWKKRR